jgi:hypothetical protein
MLYKVFIESLIEEAKKNNIEEFGIDLNIVIPSKE